MKFTKNLCTIFILVSLISVLTLANDPTKDSDSPLLGLRGGREVGNGGDFVRPIFIQVGKCNLDYLRSDEGSRFVDQFGLNLEKLEESIEWNSIQVVPGERKDNTGSVVNAIGVPGNVELVQSRWDKYILSDHPLERPVFHEQLRYAGINDDGGIVSNEIEFPQCKKAWRNRQVLKRGILFGQALSTASRYVFEASNLVRILNILKSEIEYEVRSNLFLGLWAPEFPGIERVHTQASPLGILTFWDNTFFMKVRSREIRISWPGSSVDDFSRCKSEETLRGYTEENTVYLCNRTFESRVVRELAQAILYLAYRYNGMEHCQAVHHEFMAAHVKEMGATYVTPDYEPCLKSFRLGEKSNRDGIVSTPIVLTFKPLNDGWPFRARVTEPFLLFFQSSQAN